MRVEKTWWWNVPRFQSCTWLVSCDMVLQVVAAYPIQLLDQPHRLSLTYQDLHRCVYASLLFFLCLSSASTTSQRPIGVSPLQAFCRESELMLVRHRIYQGRLSQVRYADRSNALVSDWHGNHLRTDLHASQFFLSLSLSGL